MIEYALAGVAGVATIASPCILPVLPIVLATTAGGGRLDPLLIIAGFVGAFSAGGIAIGALSGSSGELQQWIHTGSILLLLVAGFVCVWSVPFDRLVASLRARLAAQGSSAAVAQVRTGRAGLLMVGASLGLAWTPCAGPVLASMLALAASSQAPGKAMALFGAYAVGAGIPMLAIAYGGNRVSRRLKAFTRRADLLRKAFGGIAIAVAVLQLFHYDVAFIAWATQWLPSVSTGL